MTANLLTKAICHDSPLHMAIGGGKGGGDTVIRNIPKPVGISPRSVFESLGVLWEAIEENPLERSTGTTFFHQTEETIENGGERQKVTIQRVNPNHVSFQMGNLYKDKETDLFYEKKVAIGEQSFVVQALWRSTTFGRTYDLKVFDEAGTLQAFVNEDDKEIQGNDFLLMFGVPALMKSMVESCTPHP